MSEWTLRPAAAHDLDEIWNYTFNTWGLDQAEAYIEAMRIIFGRAAGSPSLGQPVGWPGKGQLRVKSGSHIIVYVRTPGGIDVVRILHQRMDFYSHL